MTSNINRRYTFWDTSESETQKGMKRLINSSLIPDQWYAIQERPRAVLRALLSQRIFSHVVLFESESQNILGTYDIGILLHACLSCGFCVTPPSWTLCYKWPYFRVLPQFLLFSFLIWTHGKWNRCWVLSHPKIRDPRLRQSHMKRATWFGHVSRWSSAAGR